MPQMFQIIQDNNYYKYLNSNGWVYSLNKDFIEINSPIDESSVGKLSAISSDDVDYALNQIPPLQKLWAKRPINERVEIIKKSAALLLENKEYLANLIVREVGKKYNDAIDEVIRTADLITFYSEQALRLSGDAQLGESYPNYKNQKIAINIRVPYGIVLAIPPFNYPLNESAPKIISALLTGNACVVKVPTQGGITNLHLAEILISAGVPHGVLTVLTGKGSVIGDRIVQSPLINVINFTGSYETANHIARIAGIKKLILGLSGKDAAIVCKDSNLKFAVRECVIGSLSYSGQRCTAIKKIMIEESVFEDFVASFVNEVESIEYEPVIDIHTAEFIEELKDDAIQKGAKLLSGQRLSSRYFKPYILSNVTDDMRIAWEEPFGPIIPLIKFTNIDEAIAIANKSEYGLQSSVFTQDINKAFYIANNLEVGTVQINGRDSRSPDHFPFTGAKKSGLGNVQGAKYLLDEVTRIKSTVINL